MIQLIAIAVLAFLVMISFALFFLQRKMIYYNQPYEYAMMKLLPTDIDRVEYQTSAGKQVAYYLKPKVNPDAPPDELWVVFGGNGSLALYWDELLRKTPMERAGYLLFDYPGYGECAGQPTMDSIGESSRKALPALAKKMNVDEHYFAGRLNLLAHSLGCAAALQFAPGHKVNNMVLVSPFTRLIDICQKVVGWPLCHLLRDRFDNRSRLAEVAAQPDRPRVTIIHGSGDEIVPVQMGRALAGAYPDWIKYIELKNVRHNDILDDRDKSIVRAMAGE